MLSSRTYIAVIQCIVQVTLYSNPIPLYSNLVLIYSTSIPLLFHFVLIKSVHNLCDFALNNTITTPGTAIAVHCYCF